MDLRKNRTVSKKQIFTRINYLSLVGEFVEVLDSKNICEIGLRGILTYESENFFYLDVGGGDGNDVKMLRKSNLIFKVRVEGKDLKINGELLKKGIIHRIKKIKKC